MHLRFSIYTSLIFLLLLSSNSQATIYCVRHVDSPSEQATAGCDVLYSTISEVNAHDLSPQFNAGDKILFRRGDIWWNETLTITSNGTSTAEITIEAFGSGNTPVIAAGVPRSLWHTDWTVDSVDSVNSGLYFSRIGRVGNGLDQFSSQANLIRADSGEQSGFRKLRRVISLEDFDDYEDGDVYFSIAQNLGSFNYTTVYYKPSQQVPDPRVIEFVAGSKEHAIQLGNEITGGGDYVRVKNIIAMLSQLRSNSDLAVIIAYGHHSVIENVGSYYGAGNGISLVGPNNIIIDSTSTYHASTGLYILGYGASNSRIESSVSAYNGNFESDGDRGGIGVQADYAAIIGNYVHDNGNFLDDAPGGGDAAISLFACSSATIEGNVIVNSVRSGIAATNKPVPEYGNRDSSHHVIKSNLIHNWNLLDFDDPNVTNVSAIVLKAWGNGYVITDPGFSEGERGQHTVINNTIVSTRITNTKLYGLSLYISQQIDLDGPRFFDTKVHNNLIYMINNNPGNSKFLSIALEQDGAPDNHYKYTQVTVDNNLLDTNPLFYNLSGIYSQESDFRLQPDSAAIDVGVDVGLTADHEANPIYGAMDIGAFEFQPAFDMAIDSVSTNTTIRVYLDGKFRNTLNENGSSVQFSVQPQGGWVAGNYGYYADIILSNWVSTGLYEKAWNTTLSTPGIMEYTIGQLKPNTGYLIQLDGINLTSGQADNSGQMNVSVSHSATTQYLSTVDASIGNDSDGDNLSDAYEKCFDGDCVNYNPYHPINNPGGSDLDLALLDTDDDGYEDSVEIALGSNPVDPISIPLSIAVYLLGGVTQMILVFLLLVVSWLHFGTIGGRSRFL